MKQGPGQHVEQKYLFAARQRDTITDWLAHACLPDPSYPRATVSSIYFDTPSLALYREKQNGDYQRCKLRLRWYDDEGDGRAGPAALRAADAASDAAVPCFLEAKRKEGPVSRKNRIELSLPRELLDGDPFGGALDRLAARAGELGYSPPGPLVPILLVRYRRWRFLDPQSLARIAVDTDIGCARANAAFVLGHPPISLESGVLEVKGHDGALPAALDPLASRLERGSFSKYAACLERLLAEPTRRR